MKRETDRINAFRDYLLKRNPSKSFADKYIKYLGGNVIKRYTTAIAGTPNVSAIDSLSKLTDIYNIVKKDSDNIRLHNVYSGVLSAYIKFLSGKELRKRVRLNKNTDTASSFII